MDAYLLDSIKNFFSQSITDIFVDGPPAAGRLRSTSCPRSGAVPPHCLPQESSGATSTATAAPQPSTLKPSRPRNRPVGRENQDPRPRLVVQHPKLQQQQQQLSPARLDHRPQEDQQRIKPRAPKGWGWGDDSPVKQPRHAAEPLQLQRAQKQTGVQQLRHQTPEKQRVKASSSKSPSSSVESPGSPGQGLMDVVSTVQAVHPVWHSLSCCRRAWDPCETLHWTC